ncbi:MAG TPA: hypothetical protein VI056_01905, partial [Candidatus Limnocylindria bacterium]
LAAPGREAAELALRRLPPSLRDRLDAMSPLQHIDEVSAPMIIVGHDRDDLVIPVGESRRLAGALAGRAGATYTEYAMFQHADPTKRRLSPLRLVREVLRFYLSLYPMFRQAVVEGAPRTTRDDPSHCDDHRLRRRTRQYGSVPPRPEQLKADDHKHDDRAHRDGDTPRTHRAEHE